MIILRERCVPGNLVAESGQITERTIVLSAISATHILSANTHHNRSLCRLSIIIRSATGERCPFCCLCPYRFVPPRKTRIVLHCVVVAHRKRRFAHKAENHGTAAAVSRTVFGIRLRKQKNIFAVAIIDFGVSVAAADSSITVLGRSTSAVKLLSRTSLEQVTGLRPFESVRRDAADDDHDKITRFSKQLPGISAGGTGCGVCGSRDAVGAAPDRTDFGCFGSFEHAMAYMYIYDTRFRTVLG